MSLKKMDIDRILVLVGGVMGIFLTYWFFLGKKEKEVLVSGLVEINVEGGYNPEVIAIPFGKTTKLIFIRKDPNSCLEEVILSDFKIRRYLPLNQRVTVEIKPERRGGFTISCGMNMFHGKIVVK